MKKAEQIVSGASTYYCKDSQAAHRVQFSVSPNIFNKDTVVRGKTFVLETGALADLDSYCVSDFIPVLPGAYIQFSIAVFFAWYDENKGFLSSDSTLPTGIFVPSTAHYIRVNPPESSVNTFMVGYGVRSLSTYQPYNGRYLEKDARIKSESADFVKTVYGGNLFDKNSVEKYITYTPANGLPQYVDGYCTSDFMPVIPGQTIYKSHPSYNLFYDSNKQFVSGDSDFELTVAVPNGCQYMRICPPMYQLEITVVSTASISGYIPYAQYTLDGQIKVLDSNIIPIEQNLKLLVFGDSFSEGGGWIAKVNAKIGFSNIVNLGVGGATMKDKYADRTTYPYTSRPPQDGSGNYNTFASQLEKLKRLMDGTDLDAGETQLYTNASDYPDLIIIQGGTNDVVDTQQQVDAYQQQFFKSVTAYGKIRAEGTVSEMVCTIPTPLDETDRTSFGGAIRYLYSTLHEMFPNARFLFISPAATVLNAGDYYQPFVTKGLQIEHACNYIAIPCINWSKSGNISYMTETITGSGTENDPYVLELPGEYTGDTLHPNNAGCEMLAIPVISKIIETFKYY